LYLKFKNFTAFHVVYELFTLHVTPRPDTMLIGREDAHKSWDSGRPLPKAILNGGLSYRARLVKV